MEEEIISRIEAAVDSGGPVEGVLFHATAEPIVGSLRPGIDGLLWTSDSPVIAQQYIPAAGVQLYCWAPSQWEMDDWVKPDRSSGLYRVACMMTGKEVVDVERDRNGDLKSWRIPEGWVRNAEVTRHIEEEMGYRASNGCWKLLEHGDEIMPADWRMPGTLFATLRDGLDFFDARQGAESDLSAYEHNNFGLFRKAEADGYDGVTINDFAQTDAYGNLGHRSWGLNGKGLASRKWISVPASRSALPDRWPLPHLTPEAESIAARTPSQAGP